MELYERDLYLNPYIEYLFNKKIIEYDMSDAGLNLSYYYNLLPKEKLDKIKALPKKDHAIQLGLIQRESEVYKNELSKAFVNMRRKLFKENGIQEDDVLSIKKDAVFMLKSLDVTQFDNVIFKDKHTYTSYIRLNGKYELYYNGDTIDVKGINESNVEKHEDGFLRIMKRFFYIGETQRPEDLLSYLVSIYDQYKWRKLDIEYYREFNPRSLFHIQNGWETDYEIAGNIRYYDDPISLDIRRVDIDYNRQILLKLIAFVSEKML